MSCLVAFDNRPAAGKKRGKNPALFQRLSNPFDDSYQIFFKPVSTLYLSNSISFITEYGWLNINVKHQTRLQLPLSLVVLASIKYDPYAPTGGPREVFARGDAAGVSGGEISQSSQREFSY